jgi:FixJ family two-component response regulator
LLHAFREIAVIAVVDDDALVRHSLARLLTSAGYEVVQYALGAEFLNR